MHDAVERNMKVIGRDGAKEALSGIRKGKPIRVAFVLRTDFLEPYLDARVYKEARSLLDAGYEVHLFNWVGADDKRPRKEMYKGVRIHRVKYQRLKGQKTGGKPSRITSIRLYWRHIHKMRDAIMSIKPSIIHCHDLDTMAEGVMAKRKLRVPLVFDAHDDYVQMVHSYPLLVLAGRIFRPYLLNRADRIITVNPILKQTYKRYKPTTILMNLAPHDFIETGIAENPKMAERLIRELDLKGKMVVTYHGMLGDNKGIPELLDTAKILLEPAPDVRFLVVGGGEKLGTYREEARKRGINSNVTFTGPVQNHQIPVYLSISHISYCVQRLQYSNITTPVKMLEGMAAGIPILANSGFPETERLIRKKKLGVLVDLEPKAIAMAIQELYADDELRRELGHRAKKAFECELNWKAQEGKLLKVYSKLLNN